MGQCNACTAATASKQLKSRSANRHGLQAYRRDDGAGAPAVPPGVAVDLAIMRSFEGLMQQHGGGDDAAPGSRPSMIMFFTTHQPR